MAAAYTREAFGLPRVLSPQSSAREASDLRPRASKEASGLDSDSAIAWLDLSPGELVMRRLATPARNTRLAICRLARRCQRIEEARASPDAPAED